MTSYQEQKADRILAIIMNYNSSSDTKKCLNLLQQQCYEALSLMIIDNGSTAGGERERVRGIAENYECIFYQNERNEGFSAANNIGIRFAEAHSFEWCLILNPDVEIRDRDYIQQVMEVIREYPETMMAGTNILLPGGKRQNPMRELTFAEELFWPIETVKQRRKNGEEYLGEDRTGYCGKLNGCCFFIRTDCIASAGYLDQNVFLYSEEAILAEKVRRQQKRMLYIHEATAYHEHHEAEKGQRYKRLLQFTESRSYYLKNYSRYGFFRRRLLLGSKHLYKICLRVQRKRL